MSFRRLAAIVLLTTVGAALAAAAAESYDPALFREMRWRTIGPHRGGRTKAAAGIPDRPAVFYVGAVNGGVWKTCLLYTSPSPRDRQKSRMPSSA